MLRRQRVRLTAVIMLAQWFAPGIGIMLYGSLAGHAIGNMLLLVPIYGVATPLLQLLFQALALLIGTTSHHSGHLIGCAIPLTGANMIISSLVIIAQNA